LDEGARILTDNRDAVTGLGDRTQLLEQDVRALQTEMNLHKQDLKVLNTKIMQTFTDVLRLFQQISVKQSTSQFSRHVASCHSAIRDLLSMFVEINVMSKMMAENSSIKTWSEVHQKLILGDQTVLSGFAIACGRVPYKVLLDIISYFPFPSAPYDKKYRCRLLDRAQHAVQYHAPAEYGDVLKLIIEEVFDESRELIERWNYLMTGVDADEEAAGADPGTQEPFLVDQSSFDEARLLYRRLKIYSFPTYPVAFLSGVSLEWDGGRVVFYDGRITVHDIRKRGGGDLFKMENIDSAMEKILSTFGRDLSD